MNPRTAYLESQVKSASPIGLIIMLYDGLITFSSDAIDYLKRGDTNSIGQAADSITKCIRILTELNSSLRHDITPELSHRLSNLYAFFMERFAQTRNDSNPQNIEDIIPLIENLRDSWKEAEKQASENSPAAAVA